mmetsp:Transcript_47306/g.102727  ORF Transcript_47306/g.102727 Transcript_47306/m.102727 type:complete len:109 (-) Transcript_47306:905-1231(-)
MLVNILYLHRRHGWLDIVGALCLVVGLCIFTLGDSTISPEWDPLGIPMVSVALLADALIGNVQEKVMRENGATQDEMASYSRVFVTNASGVVLPWCGSNLLVHRLLPQ